MAACAYRLRDAGAVAVNQARNLLHPGARCTNHADGSEPYCVCETKWHAPDDRGAAVRSHEQQTFFESQLLECALVCDADVIAEYHHVHTELQRLTRFG